MNKAVSLFKILFNTAYGISSLKYKAKKDRKEIFKFAGIIAILIISFSPIIAGYSFFMAKAYGMLSEINGQGGAIITLGVATSCVIILFFGFFYVISIFYFTNDTEYLVSLPLKPSYILGAKFSIVLLAEYLFEIPLVLPPVIVYGINSKASVLFWIYSVMDIALMPLIPLSIASILSILVMKATNIGKRRDLFRIIGMIISIFAILGVEFYIQKMSISENPQEIMKKIFAENGLINQMSSIFPPSAWISLSLVKSGVAEGFLYMILFVAASIAFVCLFLYLGEMLYFGGYIGSSETASKRKKINEAELNGEIKTKSKVMAIFWREFWILLRVPAFFINNVLPIVLVPSIFILTYLFTGRLAMNNNENLISNVNGSYISSIVVLCITLFSVVFNMTPPTSLSREGSDFYISKYIPVTPKEQIQGKMVHSLVLMIVGNIFCTVALGAIAKLSFINIFTIFVISTLSSVCVTEIGIFIDVFKPLLVWDDPQKAVKQNMNGLVSGFFNLLWNGVLIFIVVKWLKNITLGYLLLVAVYAVLGAFLYPLLINYASRRYVKIEP